jgi:hypothetical protein
MIKKTTFSALFVVVFLALGSLNTQAQSYNNLWIPEAL